MRLNYSGDRRNFDPKHIVGPTFYDDMLIPVSAEYDEARDITTLTFERLLRELWPPQAISVAARALHDRQQLLLMQAVAGHRDSVSRLMAGEGKFAR